MSRSRKSDGTVHYLFAYALRDEFAASGSSGASTTDPRRSIPSRLSGARRAPGRRTETGRGPNPHVRRRRTETLPVSGRPGGGQRLGARLPNLHRSGRRYCRPGCHIRAKNKPPKVGGTKLELLRACFKTVIVGFRARHAGNPNWETLAAYRLHSTSDPVSPTRVLKRVLRTRLVQGRSAKGEGKESLQQAGR